MAPTAPSHTCVGELAKVHALARSQPWKPWDNTPDLMQRLKGILTQKTDGAGNAPFGFSLVAQQNSGPELICCFWSIHPCDYRHIHETTEVGPFIKPLNPTLLSRTPFLYQSALGYPIPATFRVLCCNCAAPQIGKLG